MRENKMKNKLVCALAILFIGLAVSSKTADAQIASGGQFKLEQSVIAGGGTQNASGGVFAVGGTAGQSAAGQTTTNSPFSLHAGFWNSSQALAPTAAVVTVSGRIQTSDGRGIRNVRVMMTTMSGESQTALSTTFGYFRFSDVPAGETYIFSVIAKRFQFSQPTLARTILEDTDDVDFIAVLTQ